MNAECEGERLAEHIHREELKEACIAVSEGSASSSLADGNVPWAAAQAVRNCRASASRGPARRSAARGSLRR